MKKNVLALALGLALAGSAQAELKSEGLYIMAVEQQQQRLVVLDEAACRAAKPEGTIVDQAIVWQWKACDDPGVRKEHVRCFDAPDECKGRDGGKTILMTASGGAFAAIDVDSGKVRAYGLVGGNPHSVERLPDGRYVVASSEGNRLTLVDLAGHPLEPDKQVKKCYPQPDAHGLYWDAKRQVLWAYGGLEAAKYTYDAAAMTLTKQKAYPLSLIPIKMTHGHDLIDIGPHAPDALSVTTGQGTVLFNMATEKYGQWSTKSPDLKSQSFQGDNYLSVKPKEQWWTDAIFYRHGTESSLPKVTKARFYKARFLVRGK